MMEMVLVVVMVVMMVGMVATMVWESLPLDKCPRWLDKVYYSFWKLVEKVFCL